MMENEFKYSMQRGLGRCIVELNGYEDIEKYRDLVMWGCTHELSYDAQSEGTRSYYLYEMISRFPDVLPFLQAVEAQMNISMLNSGWKFNQDCELMAFFAGDGNEFARDSLEKCYEQLFEILKNKRKCADNEVLAERDNFEALCISVISSINNTEHTIKVYLKIVRDMGYLFRFNPLFSNEKFEWFRFACESMIGKKNISSALRKNLKISEEIQAYANRINDVDVICSKKSNINPITADDVYMSIKSGEESGLHFSRISARVWQRNGEYQEVKKLADYYLNESSENRKIELLKLLANRECSYSLDIDMLISDTYSQNDELQDLAFRSLCFIKSDKVYDFALSMIDDETRKAYIISMLATNYSKCNRSDFVDLIKGINISYESGEWHGAFSDVMAIFKDKSVKNPPKELLIYMYENTLCSFCRETIVKEMGKRRMLTKKILQECLYDSYNEIREYAKNKLGVE